MEVPLATRTCLIYYAAMTKTNATTMLTFWNSNGDEINVCVPTKWEICECCNGNGHMENPAFSDGISGEEWVNEWEEDERRSEEHTSELQSH